jgi:hypothetical protein
LSLGVEELVAPFEELKVVALDLENPFGILAVELGHMGGDVLEEVAVVADEDGGEAGAFEQLFEPLDALEIEVVGGLVEQEEIGAGGESAADIEAFFPTARELGGFILVIGESGLSEDVGDAHLIGGSIFDGDVVNGFAGGEPGVLRDVGEAHLLADGDHAGIGFLKTGEDLEECGLAAAVGTDKAEAVAVGDGEGYVVEQRSGAEAFGDGLAVEEKGHSFGARLSCRDCCWGWGEFHDLLQHTAIRRLRTGPGRRFCFSYASSSRGEWA